MKGWTVRNQNYYMGAGTSAPLVPNGIYKLMCDPDTSQLYLSFIQEKFKLPNKVYEMDTQLIHHVTRYCEHTTNNLGILLSGVKGSGKTVTAKQLCNTLDLPVILITRPYTSLPSFINDLKQNVVFFVDEYEKVFCNPNESLLLTVMDGALDNGFKRVFLLTINEMYISANLLERPGRIRYHKKYEDLSLDTIRMVLDDCLLHKQHFDETLRFISELQTITIDIIKAVIEEVNICDASPFTFASIFNVKKHECFVDLYEVHEDQSQTVAREFMKRFEPKEGDEVCIPADGYWIVCEILDSNTFKARKNKVVKQFVIVDREARHKAFKRQKLQTLTLGESL